eukprot:SAG25_NODE_1055_length_4168_cov_6.286803_5_plen_56_part_00
MTHLDRVTAVTDCMCITYACALGRFPAAVQVVDRKSSGEMQLWAVMGPPSEEERA